MKKFLLLSIVVLQCLTGISQTVPSYVPTNGLVGWWPFNGNANDESGNGNHGTVNGATLTTDRNGNVNSAYSFDGVSNYIKVSNTNILTLSADFTVSTWVKINFLGIVNTFISNASNNQSSLSGWLLNYSNFTGTPVRHFQAYPYFNNSTLASSTNDLTLGVWSLLTTTYSLSNGSLKYYLNGVLTDNFSITYSISNVGLNLYFGNHFQNNNPASGVTNGPLNGTLDDIGIWNRALTQQEITTLYQSQSCTLSITSQPSSQNATTGSNTNFHVGVTNTCTSPINYQWQTNTGFGWQTLQNAGQYTGVNMSTLNVSNVGSTNTNQVFRCIISSDTLSVTTQTATLTILNTNNTNLSGITHAIPYQAVVRDGSGTPLVNHPLTVRCTLHDSAASGNIVYQETHAIKTNNLGLFTLHIGTGTPSIGNIDSIHWALYKKFLQVEFDTTAQGGNYVDLGTQQLMAVPYALYAETSGTALNAPKGDKGDTGVNGTNGVDGETGPQGPQGVPGPIGPAGNGLLNGTSKNQMMYWNDTSWVTLNPGNQGQTLTLCDGELTWTTGGLCPAKVGTLNCGNTTNSGLLVAGMNGVGTTTIPYTGGNGGVYTSQSIPSTGVTGLTATLSAGTLNTGNGNLVLNITGTSSSAGTASFILQIGAQTCVLSLIVNAGSVTSLDCGNAIHTGLLAAGTNSVGTTTIPYTGGNGGVYTSQSISSTGVTGLTATLSAGTLNTGNGNLVLNITGTPSSAGTANFALIIGNQSCTITRSIQAPLSYGSTASCGATNVHNPNLGYGSVTDQDGNIYKTIQIGTQEWMAENLKTSHYTNGDAIPIVIDNNAWGSLNTGATCWYNNDSASNSCPCGRLYNWFAVADVRNVCPIGWHVPSYNDWNKLLYFVIPNIDTNMTGWIGINSGGAFKSLSNKWLGTNIGATNSSGLSTIPGGVRAVNEFAFLNEYAHFWSSTQRDILSGRLLALANFNNDIYWGGLGKIIGSSVRCIKD